jgi:hypothetical protein
LKGVLERFTDALSCIDQCFIADDMLEQLPAAARVGKTIVGGIDLNQVRMRAVVEAVIALSPSPTGFTASDVAARVRAIGDEHHAQYGPRQAAYDLKKLRGKHIVARIGRTRRYEALPSGLRAMTALIVLRNKAIKPLLAAARPFKPAASPTPNRSIPTTVRCSSPCRVFSTSSASPLEDRQSFCRASPRSA